MSKRTPLYWINPRFRLNFPSFSVEWHLCDTCDLELNELYDKERLVYGYGTNCIHAIVREGNSGLDFLYTNQIKLLNNSITNYNVAAQQKYFDKIWTNATVYTAYLCKTYNLTSKNVISHAEAGKMKIGTNHGDPDHWFVLHGRNMNDFRKDVQAILDSGAISATEPKVVKNIPLASASTSTSDYFDIHTEVTPFDMFKVWGDDSLRY